MAAGDSLGADTQKRAWAFIYALFMASKNCEDNPEDGEIRIERQNWSDNRKNGYPVIDVTARKNKLLEIVRSQNKILGHLKFTDEHFSDTYNTWLAKGQPLNILQDLRKDKHGYKANLYKFKLTLWSTILEDNEREFKRAWEKGKQNKNSEDTSSLYNEIAGECPYQGLFAFEKDDAQFFFGRENFIQTLENAVQKQPLVTVIGSSGIGKSSVIRAGLIPKLESSKRWKIATIRPTDNPFYSLAKALLELFEPEMDPGGQIERAKKYANNLKKGNLLKDVLESQLQKIQKSRILIFVDQFEELYTLCSKKEGENFIKECLKAIDIESNKQKFNIVLIITLRVDFLEQAQNHPDLGKAINKWKPEYLLKMEPNELKEVIEEPAKLANLKLQDGLTQIILDSIKNNQGSLPLLEFTLKKLWEKRTNNQLTISAYNEIGGVELALKKHAEDVYNNLDEEEKKKAKYIFTQLVSFGENTKNTRRLASRDDIGLKNWDLVIKLASADRNLEARLVVISIDEYTNQATVEIVHEALIRGWERLQDWMEEYRKFREWQDRLRIAKNIWENSDQDNGALLRGALLVEAEIWLKEKRDAITSQQEIEFILASRQHQEKQEIERIEELLILSQKELQLKQQLMSLFFVVKAAVKFRDIQEPSDDLKKNIINRLQQAIHGISEQNQFAGHSQGIISVAFSRDGSMLASTSYDRTVKLWSLDGQLLKNFEGHTGEVYEVSFSPDGQIIASSSSDRTVRLWNIDGKHLRTLEGHTDWVIGVSFSPDGQIIASSSADRTVKLWRVQDGTPLKTLEGHTDWVIGVSFSPDSQIIASSSDDSTVRLWKVEDGTLLRTLEEHTDEIRRVNFSPDSQIIASANTDRIVRLWKVEDGTLLRTLEGHTDEAWGVSFSPDGQIIASSSADRTVKLWRVQDGTPLKTLEGHTDRIWGVSFSPDGQIIASASLDRTVKLWRFDGTFSRTFEGHTSHIRQVSFSPDGHIIASASDDKTVKLWRFDGTLLRTLKGHKNRVYAVCFSPDGQIIASGSNDQTIKLWSVDGRLLKTLKGHTSHIRQVSFSPNGQIIASASNDKTVKLWSVKGKLLKTLEKHTNWVRGVSFSPNGQIIASVSDDKTVKLWSVQGGLLKTLGEHTEGVTGVSFSPDGQILASTSFDRTVRLWKVEDGTLLNTLEGHTNWVWGVSFSPDGQIIASASADRTVKLWSLDGTLLKTMEGHTYWVYGISFSPDGHIIASASADKTVRLWNIDPEDLISDLDDKLNNLLKKSCHWISNYLKTNPNVSVSDRTLCKNICSPQ